MYNIKYLQDQDNNYKNKLVRINFHYFHCLSYHYCLFPI